jgi:NAD(P)-dependent dehydrogenase (short-subunit alcohol dehydrogenase family)
MDQKKAILVIGAGDATGGAIARRFAREGYIACVARRDFEKLKPLAAQIEAAGGIAHPFACDARDEGQMINLVDQIEREVAPIEVAVFNVGANLRSEIAELSTEIFKRAWELGCLGGFLMGREVAKPMLARGRGTIIFTGATASLRGRETFAAFASAKHALRALAQSMARELWPKGIHVAHIIIDGPIDGQFIRTNFPERYALKEQGGVLSPDTIAETYWQIHMQPRNAWTHEAELRPWMERW